MITHSLVSWKQGRIQGYVQPFGVWCRHWLFVLAAVAGRCIMEMYPKPFSRSRAAWSSAEELDSRKNTMTQVVHCPHHLFILHGKYFSNND